MMRNLPTARPTRARKQNRHGEEVYEFLVRLPAPLYKDLEDRAHRDRLPKVEIVRNALRRYL